MRAIRHTFDTSEAEQYGLVASILLHNFFLWIDHNKKRNHNFRKGRTWTYHTLDALKEAFPYLTGKQIRGAIDTLIEQGVLVKDNLSRRKMDRTTWYAFKDEILWFGEEGIGDPDETVEDLFTANDDLPKGDDVLNTSTYTSKDNCDGLSEKKTDKAKIAEEILDHLNTKADRHYRPVASRLKLISDRLREVDGDVDGVKQMIDRQCARWKSDNKMSQYLRVQTLFSNKNFHDYYDNRHLPVLDQTRATTPQAPLFVQIRNLEQAIETHPANKNYIRYNEKTCTLEQRNDLRQMRERLKQLKAQESAPIQTT